MKSEVSSSAKGTSTTGQDIWHSSLFKRELQALTELPGVWYKNQNGLLIPAKEVLFTRVSFLCTASRANCRMFLPCTWALNTVGTAGTATLPNPLCRDRVCGFRVPLLSSISSPVLYTEKKLCLCSTEISQINLYFMQKKYNHADNAFISKAEICIIKPLFLKKLDSQNHKPKK